MRVAKNIRIVGVTRETAGLKTLDRLLAQLHCKRYQPTNRLMDAFDHYGFLEIHANGSAVILLNNPVLAERFLSNLRKGMDFDANIKATFAGKDLTVLKYEDGLVCFIANLQSLEIAREADLSVALEMEAERESQPPRRLPTLGELEGDILSGSNQALLCQVLEEGPYNEEGVKVPHRTLKR